MNELHRAVALAEAKVVALRASNVRARHRLTPAGRRQVFLGRLRWLALGGVALGLLHGYVGEVERQDENVRVETAFHRERMYSRNYERESCDTHRRELVSQRVACEQGLGE